MRVTSRFIVSCFFVCSTFAAFPQGAVADEPGSSWLGAYLGTAAAYSSISNTGSDDEPNGFSGVAILGANLVQESNMVFGLEGAVAMLGSVEDGASSAGNAWSISGRLGYATEDMLPFVTVGFGRAEGKYNGESEYFNSLIIGGGLEGKLNSSLNWRMEGLWSPVLEARELGGISIKPRGAIARIGITYNF